MTLTSVLISLAVGILFVFVWGIFSYIASSGGEFKSYFIGGLANFLFFFGGVVSTDLAARGTQEPSVTAIPLASSEHNSGFSVLVALYIAGATTLAFLVMNLFSDAFTNSLERMRALGSLVFTQEGYRDAQVYFGGMIGFICLFLVIVYGLYLGAVRPYASYLSILAGVALSLGMQALLYWLFGMFSNYQVLRLVRVNSPEILGHLRRSAAGRIWNRCYRDVRRVPDLRLGVTGVGERQAGRFCVPPAISLTVGE